MLTVVLAIGLVGTAMFLMAIGVVFSDKVLQGSCGGSGGSDCVCSSEEQKACQAEKRLAAH